MSKPLVFLLAIVGLLSVAQAQTNTPLPAGTRVDASTRAGMVSGVLENVATPGWICLREATTGQRVFLNADSVILRESRVAVPDIFGRMPGIPGVLNAAPLAAADTAQPERSGRVERRLPMDTRQLPGHYVFGEPAVEDEDRFKFTPPGFQAPVEGTTVLVKEAFTLGHYDRFKVTGLGGNALDARRLGA